MSCHGFRPGWGAFQAVFENPCVDGAAPALLAERGRCLALLALRAACGWLFAFGYLRYATLRFAPVRFTRFEPAALREAWKAPWFSFGCCSGAATLFLLRTAGVKDPMLACLPPAAGSEARAPWRRFQTPPRAHSAQSRTHTPVEIVEIVEMSAVGVSAV